MQGEKRKVKKRPRILLLAAVLLLCGNSAAQESAKGGSTAQDTTKTLKEQSLDGVVISRGKRSVRRVQGALNGSLIGKDELFKAACCNLGESFVTNPSVDVNYSDAATGAKQIRLLGLSGTYVQMLTENIPNFRDAATPFSLGYVPGTWMQSIQVSKGSASVKNGYESMTGQINVEYLKPEAETGAIINIYGNTESRLEVNATANTHLNKRLNTEILAHFENQWNHHDGNGDGFQDMPNVRQYNFQNRWVYNDGFYIFHGGVGLVDENRSSGQLASHATTSSKPAYRIGIETQRYEAYMKHAFVLDRDHASNLALITSASMHQQDAFYGLKTYYVNEKNLYAQLMFETDFTKQHNLSVGASVNHDYLGQLYRLTHYAETEKSRWNDKETVGGVYAQYTFTLDTRLTAMAGVRADHSSRYGTFVTPRLHLKWQPNDIISLRLSAGEGRRTVHPLAEYSNLLSSGRTIEIGDISQERAWNYGFNTEVNVPLFNRNLRINAEYYYTRFGSQVMADYDGDPNIIRIADVNGRSYSHTFQIDATYDPFKGMSVTAAWRRNIVKAMLGGEMLSQPMTSRYKGLLTASYKTPLGLWQFDATLQLNGGGRLPLATGGDTSAATSFKGYEQLSCQITRWFKHFSVYLGAENLTGKRQRHPVMGYDDPWGAAFEPTMVWGPTTGAMAYAGIRLNFGNQF